MNRRGKKILIIDVKSWEKQMMRMQERPLVRFKCLFLIVIIGLPLMCQAAFAGEQGATAPIDTGDTAWILISAALVMLMTPGLAFFYGGLVRRKNMLSVLMQCFMVLCIISIQWVVCGYSLSFGPDKHSIIGGLECFFLKGVGMEPSSAYACTVPHEVFMMFQMMFAVITPALIIGAFAERMRFSAFCAFVLLWATIVYDPIAHWIWGMGGFLRNLGALDFAGGAVVHINAGMSALVAALVLGKRRGYPGSISPPHNLPFAMLGAGLLWFGWFGFNAGSALKAGALAGSAFTATHIAGATAGATWAMLDWLKFKKPTTLGMITGAIAGLAAVTPASGFVTPAGAIWIGIGAGVFPWLAVTCIKGPLGYDDSLDAFGVHGIGGIWGVIATGIWATKTINSDGANGLLYGNPAQLWIQIKVVVVTVVYSLVVGFVLLKFVDVVMKLRVSDHEERIGLDLTQHREAAYTMID
jgi:Amt family ammonium transporter